MKKMNVEVEDKESSITSGQIKRKVKNAYVKCDPGCKEL